MIENILATLGISGEDFSIIFDWLPPDIVSALIGIFVFLVGLTFIRLVTGG